MFERFRKELNIFDKQKFQSGTIQKHFKIGLGFGRGWVRVCFWKVFGEDENFLE